MAAPQLIKNRSRKTGFRNILIKDLIRNKYIYIMLLPVVAYYLIFHYAPMYGAVIAFKRFMPNKGILGSPWIGFKNFETFFNSPYCLRIISNTVLLSVYGILFAFPAAIILALLLNEIRNPLFKKTVQTITYLPHFISLVVICGILRDFLSLDGLINDFVELLGLERTMFLAEPEWFRTIYIGSGIWQGIGWNSIIYIAALSQIDTELYEAAKIDGAGRWKQMWNVTLPGILPTIVIMLILRVGSIMTIGHEKIILLYNPAIYETADVISSYVYRKGLLESNFSFSSAVGLFNSAINFVLIISVNRISRKVSETSLW